MSFLYKKIELVVRIIVIGQYILSNNSIKLLKFPHAWF